MTAACGRRQSKRLGWGDVPEAVREGFWAGIGGGQMAFAHLSDEQVASLLP